MAVGGSNDHQTNVLTTSSRLAVVYMEDRKGVVLSASEEYGLFHFADGSGDVDVSGTRLHTVEDGAAAPHAFPFVQNIQAFFCTLITTVEDKPMGLDDGSRTDILVIGPE